MSQNSKIRSIDLGLVMGPQAQDLVNGRDVILCKIKARILIVTGVSLHDDVFWESNLNEIFNEMENDPYCFGFFHVC